MTPELLTANYGPELNQERVTWYWRGFSFKPSQDIEVSALFGGHAHDGDAFVTLYEFDGKTPTDILASAKVEQTRRERYSVSTVTLEAGELYLLAQGTEMQPLPIGGGHYRVEISSGWHNDEPVLSDASSKIYRWDGGYTDTELIGREWDDRRNYESETPDIGFEYQSERPIPEAELRVRTDGTIETLPLVKTNDPALEYDELRVQHSGETLAADLVDESHSDASSVRVQTPNGTRAWRRKD